MSRILIVEDERLIAEDLRMTLEEIGQEVIGIETEALKAVKRAIYSRPEIIFMDINLNDQMNGIEAADIIRKHYEPMIIFCTAYLYEYISTQNPSLKDIHLITKPFSPENIYDKINEFELAHASLEHSSFDYETSRNKRNIAL